MTDIVELDRRFQEISDQISDLTKELNAIQAERRKYSLEGIKSYDNFEDIVWEQKALNAYTAFLSMFLKRREAGWKPVLVNGVKYRRRPPSNEPDPYAIGDRGVIDVTAEDFWIEPDEPKNNFQEVREQRAREYNGGLRHTLDNWKRRSEWAAMRKAYLETHEDPKLEYRKQNPSTLSSYGNF